MNDRAVQDIQSGNCDSGLQMLERLKKVLEVEYPLFHVSYEYSLQQKVESPWTET